ncbi:KRAB domain-containing zinc finger protein [Sarotherodon galilaeus]
MMLTESWLTPLTPDTSVTLPGFQLLRADRTRESGKRKGGGLAVFVNDRWCNPGHITVKEQLCSRDIELLAVSMRPYYLPREFSHVIAITAYVPPSANADAACDTLHSVVSRLQTQSPRALLIISGDFNHASLDSTLPTFTQYVTCPTRDNKTLDLLYANAEEAHSSSPLPPLGRSDHNLVHLVPVYEPLVRREPPATRTVQRWLEESEEALKDCFESTVWEVICDDHGEDIDSLTTCITDYINFCVDNTVPTRTVRCFSNNKPWITPEIKAVLKQKRRAFKTKDKEELKRVQRELRGLIRNGKDSYRQKMENQLQ